MCDNISAFNSIEYDTEIERTLPFYEEFYRQVVDVAYSYKPDLSTWLDVGCGTGKMAAVLFEQKAIDKFFFIDISAEMINIAKERFGSFHTEFLVSSVQELGFVNQFDVITAIQVNHYFRKTERMVSIKRCYEALKQGKSVSECEKHLSRYNKDYFPITLSENIDIMKSCGFQAVEIFWLSYMQVKRDLLTGLLI